MDDMLKVMIREMEAKKHIEENYMQHDAHVQTWVDWLESHLPEDPFTGFNYEGDDDFALEEDF